MSWASWACLGVVVLGLVIFLYGANYYYPTAGWFGIYLCIGGVLAFLALRVYKELTKKAKPQNP